MSRRAVSRRMRAEDRRAAHGWWVAVAVGMAALMLLAIGVLVGLVAAMIT